MVKVVMEEQGNKTELDIKSYTQAIEYIKDMGYKYDYSKNYYTKEHSELGYTMTAKLL